MTMTGKPDMQGSLSMTRSARGGGSSIGPASDLSKPCASRVGKPPISHNQIYVTRWNEIRVYFLRSRLAGQLAGFKQAREGCITVAWSTSQ